MKYSQILAICAIIGIILGLPTAVNRPNIASAQAPPTQAPTANTPKTITFDTFIIHLDKNGYLSRLETNRSSINGTNDQLVAKFPAVLKSFIASERPDKHAVFLNYETPKPQINVIPNATAQSYIKEFKDSLAEANPSTHRCWFIVEADVPTPGAGSGNVHAYKCW
jgi:hypothetical protein